VIHLDTSFLIKALLPGTPESCWLRGWIGASEAVAISVVAWTEFLCGPIEREQADLATTITGEPLMFREQDAILAARLFNRSGRRRGTLVDCMIAATAIRHGAFLATSNAADFRRLERDGLRLAS
jgi:predicted nucleic acid-binding protein